MLWFTMIYGAGPYHNKLDRCKLVVKNGEEEGHLDLGQKYKNIISLRIVNSHQKKELKDMSKSTLLGTRISELKIYLDAHGVKYEHRESAKNLIKKIHALK